ncbi:hypothetical protein BDB00DRAFT_843772 [Zychaea mexicana]|uniref:uncharacterized protein n=1 Tax=Zychaea mexicana TaxID=64656 RepID=UPI0022FEED2A|nr:uncharacterized protein BDB00DRAFT_843772 [Zychaea mexicana]KAI9489299.1 hypothetical protein BDB00DRAFT_843772 [Zychaea mexicana]
MEVTREHFKRIDNKIYNGRSIHEEVKRLDVMRKNKTQLISVFETLGHDPLADWQKKAPGRAKEVTREHLRRIDNKIFNGRSVNHEVKRLIASASSNANLSQMFVGWEPYI